MWSFSPENRHFFIFLGNPGVQKPKKQRFRPSTMVLQAWKASKTAEKSSNYPVIGENQPFLLRGVTKSKKFIFSSVFGKFRGFWCTLEPERAVSSRSVHFERVVMTGIKGRLTFLGVFRKKGVENDQLIAIFWNRPFFWQKNSLMFL